MSSSGVGREGWLERLGAVAARGGEIVIDLPCQQCFYNLRGCASSGACPECATPVRASIPGVEVSADGEVMESVACGRCGYDLRGLHADGSCPECGAPVGPSVIGAHLVGADPRYVRTLHCGAITVSVAAVLQIASYAAQAVGTALGVAVQASSSMQAASFVLSALSMVLGIVGLIVFVIGWWFFATPDPVQHAHVRDGARRNTRVGTVLLGGAVPFAFTAGIVSGALGFALGPLILVPLIIGSLLALVVGAVLQYFASLVYLKRLGGRMQQAKIESFAFSMMWIGPLLVTIGACIFMIGPVVAWFLYWRLIERVRKGLREVRAMQAQAG